MKLQTNQAGLKGEVIVPPDKSISHRSIMFGAISQGTTTIHNFLRADDCLATVAAFKALGTRITDDGETITVEGRDWQFQAAETPIDIGNSGTTIRLVSGILAGSSFSTNLFGDASIAKRPMGRVMTPLTMMGVTCSGRAGSEFPPITITGTETLQPLKYHLPVASAQVKSACLFAALQATGTSEIIEKEPTRNHTEEMIRQFGGEITIEGNKITLTGPQHLQGQTVHVPGDISSAAFFLVAAAVTSNSQITLRQVGLNPTRTGILEVLKAMGADFEVKETDPNNQLGDITIRSSCLSSTTIGGSLIPRLIDELPIIALLATQAQGTTVIKDAEELKVKETNRIDAVAEELTKLGADIQPTEDGLIITGPTPLHGGEVASRGDHRIGMMLAVAALLAQDPVELSQSEAVSVSYPHFFEDLAALLPEVTL